MIKIYNINVGVIKVSSFEEGSSVEVTEKEPVIRPDLNQKNTERLAKFEKRLDRKQQRAQRISSLVSKVWSIQERLSKKVSARDLGYLLGGIVFTGAVFVATNGLDKDSGRGETVTACPEDFRGTVEVTESQSLGKLAILAKRHEVRDGHAIESVFRQSRGWDVADLAGELACRTGDLGSEHVVLLPAGVEALQYSPDYQPKSGKLPNGLEWFSDPTKS